MSEKEKRKKKKRPAKGEPGYIDSQRKFRIARTLLYVLIGFAIFFLGLLLNKFEVTNVFTVFAILAVLPAARSLVGFIVLIPYHSVTAERMERVRKALKGKDIIYTDMVFTSPEKVMCFSFLVITDKEIFCLVDREKEDITYMERYIKTELKKRQISYKLTVTREEKSFLDKVEHAAPAEDTPEELTDYLRSLMV